MIFLGFLPLTLQVQKLILKVAWGTYKVSILWLLLQYLSLEKYQNCFKYIHCYLNIPDTNDRDSLFQAEAKVCKKIIDYIDDNENDLNDVREKNKDTIFADSASLDTINANEFNF